MRRVLIIAVAAASLVSVQTAALAQNADNPNNDQRSKCEKRWDAMVSAHQTQNISRDEYLRKCTKGAYLWGGENYVPEFALLGLAGVGLGVGLSTGGNNHPPVSP